MNSVAIHVENISKQYCLSQSYRHDTLRDKIADRTKDFLTGSWKPAGKRSFWALKDISFDIGQGQIVGIIGQNGAGKSTLLKILSQIVEPTRGRAEIYGRVGSLLEVGTGFHQELTGRENIYLNGAIIGMTKTEISRVFDAIVAFAEVEKFIDMPVKRYSSGMYVRLAFAVSAHLRPEILMIDEVLSVGDLHFQRKCMSYAEDLRKSNSTILFVSHNMFAVKSMCSRVIFLSCGEIGYDGAAAEAIQRYENENKISELEWAKNVIGSESSQWPIYATEVDTFDEEWQQRTLFNYGERMRIRLKLSVREPVTNLNLVISFVRSDDVACCNYSTSMDGFSIPSLTADSTIDLQTPPLKLVSESYQIHVLVRDLKFERLYCAQMGKIFHVRHHLLDPQFGVFHERGEWSMPIQSGLEPYGQAEGGIP